MNVMNMVENDVDSSTEELANLLDQLHEQVDIIGKSTSEDLTLVREDGAK